MQERCNSIANALELRLACINPSIYQKTPKNRCFAKWFAFSEIFFYQGNIWVDLFESHKNGLIIRELSPAKGLAFFSTKFSLLANGIPHMPVKNSPSSKPESHDLWE